MKFIKGIIMGTVISAGAVMMYNEMSEKNKRKIMKKGKQLAKKMGII